MKKIIIFAFLLLSISNTQAYKNFEFTPININFYGIEVKGDTIISYGDFGSALISTDNAKSWKQIRIFENGVIIKIIFDDDKIIAINRTGKINVSKNNNGFKWDEIIDLKDTVLSVIKMEESLYMRTTSNLIVLDDKFNILKSVKCNNIKSYLDKKLSLTSFQENLVVAVDSSKFIRYNPQLLPIDTLNSKSFGICSTCTSRYQSWSDSLFFYFKIDNNKVYKTENFKKVFKHYDSLDFSNIRFINGKTYVATSGQLGNRFYELTPSGSLKYIYEFNYQKFPRISGSTNYIPIKDFYFFEGLLYYVGSQKFLAINDTNNKISESISDFFPFNPTSTDAPIPINDSCFIFYSSSPLYSSSNKGITFKSSVNDSLNPLVNNFTSKFKYFDLSAKRLYLFGYYDNSSKPYVLISNDNGFSFDSTAMTQFNFIGTFSNLQKRDNDFIISRASKNKKTYNTIFTYDLDFKIKSIFFDTCYNAIYLNSRDTNSFLLLTENDDNSLTHLKNTNNKGKNWDTLMIFGFTEDSIFINGSYIYIRKSDILDYKEVSYLNNFFWLLTYYEKKDTSIKLGLIDLKSLNVKNILSKKLDLVKLNDLSIASFLQKDTLYIFYDDSLFISTDIMNEIQFKKLKLPSGSKIDYVFTKFGDLFYASYSDCTNEKNHYWIKYLGIDSGNNVIDIAPSSYLYSFPPFPIPAQDKVSTLIYWDASSDIGTDEISVFDVEGNKAEGKENITIDLVNTYSGHLRWDCSGVPNGIYLIKIKHGTTTKCIKVIVER